MQRIRLYLICLLGLPSPFFAQEQKTWNSPSASFSFNGGSALDAINKQEARMPGAVFTEDRFGNAGNAVYLFGNENSYINLGSYKALKPRAGSISLWINIPEMVWSGRGIYVNPILLTKCSNGNDFFEAYSMYFAPSPCFCVNCSRDSLHQVVLPSMHEINVKEWHHLVLTFNDDFISFYVDGELQGRQVKNFETRYLAGDSVLVGVTANKKNNRFLRGRVDDIAFYDRVLSAEEVLALYHAPDPNKMHILAERLLMGLGMLCLLVLGYIVARWQLGKSQNKEKQRLQLTNKLLEAELRVNRGLMNPHFIYNSLYSAQSFILNHETERANTYLVKFSKLLRKILEGNRSDSISLAAEIDLLQSFVEIENIKFDGEIHCCIETEDAMLLDELRIPVMMIQPFVENAIWHGLKNKPGHKSVQVSFSLKGRDYLECVIEDNGLGRKVLEAGSTNSSMAIVFIKTRLDLLNKLRNLRCELQIIDKPKGTGTIIKMLLPIVERKKHGRRSRAL